MKTGMTPLCISIGLALVQPAIADQEADRMTVWSSPASATTTILGQEMMEKLDKQNVASALATVPGVTLQKSGGRNELQVKVRGFDSRQIPIFLDGVPIYVPYDGNFDLGRILTSDIASLEVSKDYSSLLQGPNQMGGAINITTQKPSKPLEGGLGYRQSWSRGSDNAKDMHASLGLSNDRGFIQLNGSKLKQDYLGLPHGVSSDTVGTHGRMINSSAEDTNGVIKVGFTPRVNDEYTFTYINQNGEKDSPPYAGTLQTPRYWQWPQYDKESYYYQGTTHLGERFTLKSRLYHDSFKNTLLLNNTLEDLQNKRGGYSHYADFSTGGGLQLSADVRESDLLSFAINWKNDTHREKGAPTAPYDRYRDRTWSIASEYQWAATQNLDIVSGISYDWRDSVQGMKHEKNGSLTFYENNSKSAFNWETLARYHLNHQDWLSLSLSDRTRFPTLKERYTTMKPAMNQIALVNPQLKAERAQNIALTWSRHINGSWRYETSIWYNRVSDAIVSKSISDRLTQNQNSGRINYSGVDIGINGSPLDMLDVGASYGLIHADIKSREAGKPTGQPTQTLTSWLTFRPLDSLRFTLSEEARSSSYSNSSGTQKAAGFAVTHLRADYNVGYGISVNASVNNLFDSKYALSEGFIEEGRNVWAGIEYKF